MTFFNQFHKEVTERKMRKIAASQQSPINSNDFAQYMKRTSVRSMRSRIKGRER